MAKFKFPYETLIRYRETRLLLAQKEMFRVEGEFRRITDARQKAIANRIELLESQRKMSTNINGIQLLSDLVQTETNKVKRLDVEILTVSAELERHKNWVAHLGRELKIIEKLREKRKTAFDLKEKIREQKSVDSWVTQDWGLRIAKMEEGQQHEVFEE